MSWSSRLRRITAIGVVLGLATALSACSFSPVYSGTLASQPLLDLAFAKPASRLEQVIYQELRLRFGSSEAETAPLATVAASASGGTVGLSQTANPNKLARMTVTATLTIRRDGTSAEPINFTRVASADYTTSGQVLADSAAAQEAVERAGKAAAESLRLAVLASLSR